MEQSEIHEAGLLIRPWRTDDAESVCRACQDPEIPRWTGVPSPYTMADADDFVTIFTRQQWASGAGAPMGVFDADSGDLLGSCGLPIVDRTAGTAEIGYWIAPWARRRGVATAAARAVSRWALGPLGLRRLVWRAEIGNHASRLVAEDVGFRIEGVQRQRLLARDGRARDGWVGSMLPGDLREADAPPDPVRRRQARTFHQPQPTVAAGGVTLRPLRCDDVEAVIAASRDPEAVRWTTVPDPYRVEDGVSFVARHAPDKWARGTGAVFAIITADGGYAGTIDLDLLGHTTADVGYLVTPAARGHGHATAALRGLCAWSFDALALHRIAWQAYVGNHASRRVAEKAGFTVEGTARGGCIQRGEARDVWTGARLSTDLVRSEI